MPSPRPLLDFSSAIMASAACREILHGGRALGRQLLVGQQGDVLHGVGHAVALALEVHGLDRDIHELARLGAEVDLGDQAGLDEVTDGVVRVDDKVRALSGRALGLEVVLDLP